MKEHNYNLTDLNPEVSFEKHVFHRDQFAHYLRWSHVLKIAKVGMSVLDFGCGSGNLAEVFYRNKFKCKKYLGLDLRQKTINNAREKFKNVEWIDFTKQDLCGDISIGSDWDLICSFEVIEHIGKQRAGKFLENIKKCSNKNTVILISTPNYDEKVGAAGNHTFDSGDGRGVAPQEFEHNELQKIFEDNGFEIVEKFGTFASIKDYKGIMNDWQEKMFNHLKNYYDVNILSNLMAPFFPEQSRNTLWKLKIK